MFDTEILTFLIGLIVGGNLGVLLMCLVGIAKEPDTVEVEVQS